MHCTELQAEAFHMEVQRDMVGKENSGEKEQVRGRGQGEEPEMVRGRDRGT